MPRPRPPLRPEIRERKEQAAKRRVEREAAAKKENELVQKRNEELRELLESPGDRRRRPRRERP